RMALPTSIVITNVPVRQTSTMLRHVVESLSTISEYPPKPAAFTSPARGGMSASEASRPVLTACSSVMSACRKCMRDPCASDRSCCSPPILRSMANTDTCFCRSRSVTARPMPEAAPVTTMVCSMCSPYRSWPIADQYELIPVELEELQIVERHRLLWRVGKRDAGEDHGWGK